MKVFSIIFFSFFFILESSKLQTQPARKFFATTVEGMEKVLMLELKDSFIGAINVAKGKCGVYFEGNDSTAFSALMWSRTAIRIMEQIVDGSNMKTKDDLYGLVASVDWRVHLSNDDTLKVDTTLGQTSRDLSHTHFNSLTVKNAIVDQFRDNTGRRPSVDINDPLLPLLLYIHKEKATLYRVWSGEQSMHKRGYRQVVHKAALRETTAAALLQVAEWNSDSQILCDPMCGSGTIAIEAALMAAQTAPGLLRFGHYEHPTLPPPRSAEWPGMDESVWDDVWFKASQCDLRKTIAAEKRPPVIFANDWHKGAIELAVRSSAEAGVHRMIDFSCRDISEYQPREQPDIVLTNPPWDRRLDGADESWEKLGEFARAEKPSLGMWTLSGNELVMDRLRLHSERGVRFNAASVDLSFVKFDTREIVD